MIDLKNQTNETISVILNKYLIDHEIDSDGDIFIESPCRMYIRSDDSQGILRFFSFIHLDETDGVSSETFNEYLNFINSASYTVKYSKLNSKETRSALSCEYGIVLTGSVDENFIIRTIRRLEKEITSTKQLATNYDSLMEEINRNAQETNSKAQ